MLLGRQMLFAAVFVPALLCNAQQDRDAMKPVTPEIRGTILEFGTSRGIDEVEVTLEGWADGGPRLNSSQIPRSVIGTTMTDSSGVFVFPVEKLGDYRVRVRKEGYVVPDAVTQDFSTNATVSLDRARPRRELRFLLARPGEISGRFVYKDTQEPVVGLPVYASQYGYSRGRLRTFPEGGATTDTDGRFVVRRLAPGDYLLALGSRMRTAGELKANPQLQQLGVDRLLTGFSDEDLRTEDWDHERTYWPGGSDLSMAVPLLVSSGGAVDMGQLPVKKVPVYPVRVSFLDETCLPGAFAKVDVRAVLDPWRPDGTTVGNVPCGKDFLMRGFAPGPYRLEVVVFGGDRGSMQMGSVPFEVVDKRVEISVPVARGVDVAGKVLLTEGASKPDFKTIQLLLMPIGWVIVGDYQNPIDAQGKFRIVNTAVRDQQLYVSGLAAPHYVKEVRYNGHRISDNVLPMDANALSQSLEIVLDDKPATVMGAVTDRDKPVSQPHLMLVRWPPNSLDLFLSVSTVAGDDNGKFAFSGLAPGDYRILAVSPEDRGKLDDPNLLQGLLASAEKLTLSEREVKNLTLKVARP